MTMAIDCPTEFQISDRTRDQHKADHVALHGRYWSERVVMPGASVATIQAHLDALKAAGGGVLRFAAGVYDVGADTLKYQGGTGLVLRGAGQNGGTIIRGSGASVVLDLIGSDRVALYNLHIATGQPCDVGILLARRVGSSASSSITLQNVSVVGEFNKAAIYSINSEVNSFFACTVRNTSKSPNTYGFYTSTENDLGVTSSGGVISQQADNATNSVINFFGGALMHYGAGGTACGIFGNTRALNLTGAYLFSRGRDVALGPSSAGRMMGGPVSITGCSFEGEAAKAIWIGDVSLYRLVVTGNLFAIKDAPPYSEIWQEDVPPEEHGLNMAHIAANRHSAAVPASFSRVYYSEITDIPQVQIRHLGFVNTYRNVYGFDLSEGAQNQYCIRLGRYAYDRQGVLLQDDATHAWHRLVIENGTLSTALVK